MFKTFNEAQNALWNLSDIALKYGYASVADLKELTRTTSDYEDNRYGWDNLRLSKATISGSTGCYILSLPNAVNIGSLEKTPHPRSQTSITTPLQINFYPNDLKDPNETLAEVFKYVYTIKDREVRLTIM